MFIYWQWISPVWACSYRTVWLHRSSLSIASATHRWTGSPVTRSSCFVGVVKSRSQHNHEVNNKCSHLCFHEILAHSMFSLDSESCSSLFHPHFTIGYEDSRLVYLKIKLWNRVARTVTKTFWRRSPGGSCERPMKCSPRIIILSLI